MNAPSVDIAHMLEADGDSSGIGLTLGSNLFVGKQPSKPDICVTLFDTPSSGPSLGLTSHGYEYLSIQVLVRDIDYRNGMAICQEIVTSLHGRSHQTWNGALYTVIQCVSSPTLLEYDDNSRVNFVINFNLQRRVA